MVPIRSSTESLSGLTSANSQVERYRSLLDGTSRYSIHGETVAVYSSSTFSEYCVVPEVSAIKVDTELPWEYLALVGCAVTTGVGAAINTALRYKRSRSRSRPNSGRFTLLMKSVRSANCSTRAMCIAV